MKLSTVYFLFMSRFLLLLFFCLKIDLSAQTYPFKHYSTADGLTHAVVRKVFQDSRGFIWFGTRGGVDCYDGNEFVTWLSQDSLKSEIYDIWEDEDGTMWFATYGNGLAKKMAGDTAFVWIKASTGILPGDYVTFIFKDDEKNIWIGNGDGLSLIKKDGMVKIYDQELGFGHGEVYAFTRGKDGTLWIGTHRGLLKGRLEFDDQLKLNRILAEPTRSLLLLKNGDVLVGTSGRSNDRDGVVCRFSNDVPDTLISYQLTRSLIKAQTLFEDSMGRIWIGTGYGIFVIQEEKISHLRRENGLYNENIFDIMEDREGTMWFGTESGVMKLVAPVFLSYGMEEDLNSYTILCMLSDIQNNLWLGYWNGLDCVQPNGQISFWNETNGLYHHTVKSIAQDEDETIWIGTELGLNLFRSGKIYKKYMDGLPIKSEVWSMQPNPEAGIWLGLKGMIVYSIQGKTKIILGQSAGIPMDVITTLFVDHQQRLWFGTENHGVGMFEKDKLTLLNHENGLPSDNIHCFFQDEFNKIWIGTNRGLALWQDGQFEKLPFHEPRLEQETVYFVLRDSLRHLWFGTDYGLYEWNGTAMHHFNTHDGLACDIVTRGIVKTDGSLWFGTQDGLSCLKSTDRLQYVPVPNVYFDKILAGDAERPIYYNSVVAYSDRSIVFMFNALSYVDEKSIQFQWMLTGFDKSWNKPYHQHRVRYTNLGPGEYTFQVRAANRNGDWSVPVKFNFKVRPPYWATWWFILLVILFLSTLLWLIYQYRINQLRKIENMRSQIAADLHDDIASSLASIALYSEVIQRQLQSESAEARSLLSRISDLSREVMENIGIIVWAVDPRRDELKELLEYFQRHARQLCNIAGVTFLSHLPAELKPILLSPEQRRSIYLILKEGLNNILRHAYCSQVVFSCTYHDRILELSLQDDGLGFDVKSVTGGHGLANIRLRAQKIEADIQIVSQPGQGSVIHLRLRMT
ncbi:hypothetical protein JW964_29000 [candidate division KSB1 bacterium]|nr:hypothetical protein [candidate division KSB1 bacterium]